MRIRSQIIVEFAVGNEERAYELYASLKDQEYYPISVQTIHPGTLKSFLREKWNQDVDVPEELFSTYTGQVAEFILPKPDKTGKKSAKR